MRKAVRTDTRYLLWLAVDLLAKDTLTPRTLAQAAGCSVSKIHKYLGEQHALRAATMAVAHAEMLEAMRGARLPEMPLRERATGLAEALTPPVRWRAWVKTLLHDRLGFEEAFALALDGVPTAPASAAMAWGILTSPRLTFEDMAVRRQVVDLIIGPAVLFSHRLGDSEAARQ